MKYGNDLLDSTEPIYEPDLIALFIDIDLLDSNAARSELALSAVANYGLDLDDEGHPYAMSN